mgnify:CR=1 FL=1
MNVTPRYSLYVRFPDSINLLFSFSFKNKSYNDTSSLSHGQGKSDSLFLEIFYSHGQSRILANNDLDNFWRDSGGALWQSAILETDFPSISQSTLHYLVSIR